MRNSLAPDHHCGFDIAAHLVDDGTGAPHSSTQEHHRSTLPDGQRGKLERFGRLQIRQELEIQTLGLIFAIDLNDPIF